MATPSVTADSLLSLQQTAVAAGALEWEYKGNEPISIPNETGTPPTRDKDFRTICRVYRNPGVNRYTNLINDAGPIWGVQVFKRPPYSGTTDADKGFTGDAARPYQTKWDDFSGDDALITGDNAAEKEAARKQYDQRLGAAYFQNDGTGDWAGQQVLDNTKAKQAVCWTLAEAIETGARLAASFSDDA